VKAKIHKGHIVRLNGGGHTGRVVWVGVERDVPVALVRWDATGCLQLLVQDVLSIQVIDVTNRVVRASANAPAKEIK
jgi:hypothetical protein